MVFQSVTPGEIYTRMFISNNTVREQNINENENCPG